MEVICDFTWNTLFFYQHLIAACKTSSMISINCKVFHFSFPFVRKCLKYPSSIFIYFNNGLAIRSYFPVNGTVQFLVSSINNWQHRKTRITRRHSRCFYAQNRMGKLPEIWLNQSSALTNSTIKWILSTFNDFRVQ